MNYYPFHVGDYAAHTAHLTWEEDIAYRRLLDLYYLHEKPVPADVQRLARLIRMPQQAQAIEAVLAEFFELREDGWHNKRADDELARMAEKTEASEERDEHEKARMRRYRERRARMFAALREVGVVPAWDVSMRDLQRLHDEHCNGSETDLQRNSSVSGDAPATAIPTPTPTPTPNTEANASVVGAKRATKKAPADFDLTSDMEQWARDHAPLVHPLHELAKFKDHTFATARVDWLGTWRNWMRKAQEEAAQKAVRAHGAPGGTVGTAWTRHIAQRASKLAPGVAARPHNPPQQAVIIPEEDHGPLALGG